MEKVLLVSSSDNAADVLGRLVLSVKKAGVTAAATADEARQLLVGDGFDLVLVNHPLAGANAADFARQTAREYTCGVLLLCPQAEYEGWAKALAGDGVLVLAKPVVRAGFVQAFYQGLYTRARLARLMDENQKLHLQIEEIKLISRAKAVLIEYLKLTEAQAHHYIEKQAMDLRLTKTEIAQNILTTYET